MRIIVTMKPSTSIPSSRPKTNDALLFALAATVNGPVKLVDVVLTHLVQLDRLGHLAYCGVGAYYYRVTVLFSEVEGQICEVGVLLNGGGGEDDGPVIAVAAAAGELPVVALALEDVAQGGAYTHDVSDDRRHVAAHR